jgi:hypothetical protein
MGWWCGAAMTTSSSTSMPAGRRCARNHGIDFFLFDHCKQKFSHLSSWL